MTAINLYTGPEAAYLLVDQAWLANGKILFIGTKIAKCPRLKMAVAYHGASTTRTISLMEQWLDTVRDQETALGALHKLLGMIRMDALLAPRSWQGSVDANLFVALWRGDHPEAYVVTNVTTRAHKCQAPPTQAPLPIDHTDHAALIRCIEEQRRAKTKRGEHVIGGKAELVVVTADGIASEILCEWPDQVGEPITP